jgi:hypothetical protein
VDTKQLGGIIRVWFFTFRASGWDMLSLLRTPEGSVSNWPLSCDEDVPRLYKLVSDALTVWNAVELGGAGGGGACSGGGCTGLGPVKGTGVPPGLRGGGWLNSPVGTGFDNIWLSLDGFGDPDDAD